MTFGQSPNAALDQIIRQARYLFISFDGPIRSASEGNPPAPHILDVLTACRESGRSVAVISERPAAEVRAYLDAHGLSLQVAIVSPSIAEAISALEASPTNYAAVISSANDIRTAQIAGIPIIAYARVSNDADSLPEAGLISFVYSMIDLALTLRRSPI